MYYLLKNQSVRDPPTALQIRLPQFSLVETNKALHFRAPLKDYAILVPFLIIIDKDKGKFVRMCKNREL